MFINSSWDQNLRKCVPGISFGESCSLENICDVNKGLECNIFVNETSEFYDTSTDYSNTSTSDSAGSENDTSTMSEETSISTISTTNGISNTMSYGFDANVCRCANQDY